MGDIRRSSRMPYTDIYLREGDFLLVESRCNANEKIDYDLIVLDKIREQHSDF
jgi:hypothetical protein